MRGAVVGLLPSACRVVELTALRGMGMVTLRGMLMTAIGEVLVKWRWVWILREVESRAVVSHVLERFCMTLLLVMLMMTAHVGWGGTHG